MSLPQAALALTVVGLGVQVQGMRQQASVAAATAQHRENQLANQQIVLQDDIKHETEAERVRQRLIAVQGNQQRGKIRVGQAALGQVVDVGSAADTTSDLAAEIEFKKLMSQNRSDLMVRNLTIEAQTVEGNIGAARLEAQAARSSAKTQIAGSFLTTGTRLATKFDFGSKGNLKFRTQ